MTRPLNLDCTDTAHKLGITGTSVRACFCMSVIWGNFSMAVLIPHRRKWYQSNVIYFLHRLSRGIPPKYLQRCEKSSKLAYSNCYLFILFDKYRWLEMSVQQYHVDFKLFTAETVYSIHLWLANSQRLSVGISQPLQLCAWFTQRSCHSIQTARETSMEVIFWGFETRIPKKLYFRILWARRQFWSAWFHRFLCQSELVTGIARLRHAIDIHYRPWWPAPRS